MELSSLEKHHNQNMQKRETINGSHPSKLLKQKQMSVEQEEAQYIINQQQQQAQQHTNIHHHHHSSNINNGVHGSGSIGELALQQQQQNHVSTQEIQRTAFARAHFRHVAVRGLIGKETVICMDGELLSDTSSLEGYRIL